MHQSHLTRHHYRAHELGVSSETWISQENSGVSDCYDLTIVLLQGERAGELALTRHGERSTVPCTLYTVQYTEEGKKNFKKYWYVELRIRIIFFIWIPMRFLPLLIM